MTSYVTAYGYGMMASRNIPIQVRPASFDDYSQIAALQSRFLLEAESRQHWEHLWLNNPVYRRKPYSWPIGWVLQNSGQKIVGYLGNIPLLYEFERRQYLAATTRAWVVEPSARSYALLLLDYFFHQPDVDLYVTTTLNRNALPGFEFFGPAPVPAGDWGHSTFWITNYTGFLVSALKAKDVVFAHPLSRPVCILPALRDHFHRARASRGAQGVDIQLCPAFDERFDRFWEDLRRKRSGVLLGTRTREILNWHFKYSLLQKRTWVFSVADGPRLLAYSIFSFHRNPSTGLTRMRLVDFQTLADDERHLEPMLAYALNSCRSERIHMLEAVGPTPERAALFAKLRPYQRKLVCWAAYYKPSNPKLKEVLKDPKRWDLSLFDGDSTL